MEQSVKAGITTAVAAGLALVGAPASAAAPGWYVGLSGGQTNVEFEAEDVDFEADDTAFKVFGGYMFNAYFGAELAYLDLGDLGDSTGFDGGEFGPATIETDAEVTGFSAELVAQYPLGPVDLFLKAGILAGDLEGDVTARDANGNVLASESVDNSDESAIVSFGARYNVGQFGIRGEYQVIDEDNIDEFSVMSLGVEYRFAM